MILHEHRIQTYLKEFRWSWRATTAVALAYAAIGAAAIAYSYILGGSRESLIALLAAFIFNTLCLISILVRQRGLDESMEDADTSFRKRGGGLP